MPNSLKTFLAALAVSFACAAGYAQPVFSASAINAAGCSAGDVQNAIQTANPGDTVSIPAGSCAWTSGITIDKSITLIGAGEGSTVITDHFPGGSLIWLSNWTPIAPRISGLTINATTRKTNSLTGVIGVSRASSGLGFRIDHVTFNTLTAIGVVTWDWTWGVIDHCTFNAVDGSTWSILFNADSWGGPSFNHGDKAWNDPDGFGTQAFVFVEDCAFNNSAAYPLNFSDSYGGARYVMRYNTFTNGFLRAHGTDSTPKRRGTRAIEIYNNSFVNNLAPIAEALEFRSGTAVFYNNAASGSGGVNNGMGLKCFRDNANFWAGWGRCDGSSYYDQNAGGQGGYACLDQPGRGQSGLMTSGDDPQPHSWPNQASSPVYVWGNAGFKQSQAGSTSARIQSNRDFYLDASKPGYTAFTYPHPLTGGAATPNSPSLSIQ